jgi:hypothetical protein
VCETRTFFAMFSVCLLICHCATVCSYHCYRTRYLPLERVQLELATQRELTANSGYSNNDARKTFTFRGCLYDCAQFDAWLPVGGDKGKGLTNTTTADGNYDIFLCAHESDLDFVCRLKVSKLLVYCYHNDRPYIR